MPRTRYHFRAWDTFARRMKTVDALAFSNSSFSGQRGPEILVSCGKPYQKDIEKLPTGGAWSIADPDHPHGNHPSTVILMQASGLLDRNGREIFEEDILRGTGVDGTQRVWVAAPLSSFHHWQETEDLIREHGDIEVIGNRYQNPDLLPR